MRKITKIENGPYLFVGGSTLSYINGIDMEGRFIENFDLTYGVSYFLKDRITSQEVLNFIQRNNSYDVIFLNYGFGDSTYEIKNRTMSNIFKSRIHNKSVQIFLFLLILYKPRTSLDSFENNTNKILQLMSTTCRVIFIINLPTVRHFLKNIARARYKKLLKRLVLKNGSNNCKILDISIYDKSCRVFDSHHLNLKGAELLKSAIELETNAN